MNEDNEENNINDICLSVINDIIDKIESQPQPESTDTTKFITNFVDSMIASAISNVINKR